MIKLNSKCMIPDYTDHTDHGSVSTDCKTVGELMTEAVATYGGILIIEVDGCRYEFEGYTKVSVTDNTPIDEVLFSCAPGSIIFIVKTKPKPKTVRKSGWVNVWRSETDGITYCGENIYKDKSLAERVGKDCGNNIATVKIEWEEVTE